MHLPTPAVKMGSTRRSKRLENKAKGKRIYVTSPLSNRKKCNTSSPKMPALSVVNVDNMSTNSLFPGPVKFPNLTELEKAHNPCPEISVDTLQLIAVDRCSAPPGEMAQDRLLRPRELRIQAYKWEASCVRIFRYNDS